MNFLKAKILVATLLTTLLVSCNSTGNQTGTEDTPDSTKISLQDTLHYRNDSLVMQRYEESRQQQSVNTHQGRKCIYLTFDDGPSDNTDKLLDILKEEGVKATGKVCIGTVKGDLHDIGKNLVGMMIEGAGFEVIDLGVDVPAEKFVETIKANPDCKLVGLSALLTTTMDNMEATVKAIKDAGLPVTIMVGGAPITQAFADEIGADAYTTDAASAALKAKELAC